MISLFYKSECGSTNDEVSEILLHQSLNFCALYTFNQTKGKGQYGNSWKSSKNLNVAYSLSFPVDATNCPQSLFNFYTAILFRRFIANLTQTFVEIKWPNDIIIKNKKISGMLTEKQKIRGKDHYIVGIGVNVLQKNFDHLPNAGSILTQTEKSFELHDFAEILHAYMTSQLFTAPHVEEILEEYNKYLFRKNKISVFELQNIRQNGIILHCMEDGSILIQLEQDGERKFFNKEISLCY